MTTNIESAAAAEATSPLTSSAASAAAPQQDARQDARQEARPPRALANQDRTYLLGAVLHELANTNLDADRRMAAMRVALREATAMQDHLVLGLLKTHKTEFAAVANDQFYHTNVETLLVDRFASPAHVSGILAMQAANVVAAHVDALLMRAVLAAPRPTEPLLDVLVMTHGARVSHADYAVLRAAVARNDVVTVRHLVRLLRWEALREPSGAHQVALAEATAAALRDADLNMARELAVSLPLAPAAPAAAHIPLPQAPPAPQAPEEQAPQAPQAKKRAAPPAPAAGESSDTEEEVDTDALSDAIRAHYRADITNSVPEYRVHMFVASVLRVHRRRADDAACRDAMRAALNVYPASGAKPGSSVYMVRSIPK
jgi:hypothetical protein